MRRTTTALVLMGVLLAGCVAQPVSGQELAQDAELLDLLCRDRIVNVNHGPDRITVAPPYLEVCGGSTIRIILTPSPNEPRTARTTGTPEWLNRENESPDINTIEIDVPGPDTDDVTVGMIYKYTIVIDGVGSLDPSFRIIR